MPRDLAAVLAHALHEADRRGLRRPRLSHLTASEVHTLAGATLQYLRGRPSHASPIPGWVQVRSFDAAVLRWWNAELGGAPFPSDTTKRLQTLRGDVYDHLEAAQALIVKKPGQTSPVHLAPEGPVLDPDDLANRPELVTVSEQGAGYGDPQTNRLVEEAAMAATILHYPDWVASDVSPSKCGWDITLERPGEELHIEVKGVSGPTPSVLLTRNEFKTAKADPRWRLVVVTRALVAPRVDEYGRDGVLAASEPYVYRTRLTARTGEGQV